jgi:hypothetical protein
MVDEAQRLWSTGQWSQRQISRYLGICRATVRLIVLGQYTVRLREKNDHELAMFDPDAGPPERCPTCGGTVYLPCHLCYIRGLKSQPQPLRRAS